jgi:hypothetical protein
METQSRSSECPRREPAHRAPSGIETGSFGFCQRVLFELQEHLVECKPVGLGVLVDRLGGFTKYLAEWKPRRLGAGDQRCDGLQKYLLEWKLNNPGDADMALNLLQKYLLEWKRHQ